MRSILPLVLLFIGETVYIWAEMMIAKTAVLPASVGLTKKIIYLTTLTLISGMIIVVGYFFGYKYTKNIWLVTATSISSILITEPLVSWFTFHELPGRGASIGLIFGAAGLIATLIL